MAYTRVAFIYFRMYEEIFFGASLFLFLLGVGCEPVRVPAEAPGEPEKTASVQEMPLNDPDARYILTNGYSVDYTDANAWNYSSSPTYFYLQYIKNNTVVQQLPVREVFLEPDNKSLYWFIGQDVRVTGIQKSEKRTEIVYCTSDSAPCPPREVTDTFIEIADIQGSPRPFVLDDPTATYTLREWNGSGMWYVVYTKGNEIPRVVRLTTLDAEGRNVKEKSPADPAPFKDKRVRIIGSVETSPRGSFIRPEKIIAQ